MSTEYQKQILTNAIPNWQDGEGIFSVLSTMHVPWADAAEGLVLDMEYIGNRSGLKFCSPIVYSFMDDDKVVTENGRTALARMLYMRYNNSWQRLWDAYNTEYDPLHDYDITEVGTRGLDSSGSRNGSEQESGTITGRETTTDSGSVDTTQSGTNHQTVSSTGSNNATVTNTRNAFNDGTGTQTGAQTTAGQTAGSEITSGTTGSTVSTTTSDTATTTRNDTTSNSRTFSESNSRNDDESHNIHRYGKNWRTSYQDLLQKERELWIWDYFDKVFSDCDKILTLPYYDPCLVQSTKLYEGGKGEVAYVLPIATESTLGGVKGPTKTTQTQQVAIDENGNMWVPAQVVYNLPVATSSTLGGVKPVAKTEAMTQPVGVNANGELYTQPPEDYTLPVATSSTLGGVKPVAKTETMTQSVGVNANGELYTQPGVEYTLPVATSSTLGGVKAAVKTDAMTDPVGVDANGAMYTSTIPVTVTTTDQGALLTEFEVGKLYHFIDTYFGIDLFVRCLVSASGAERFSSTLALVRIDEAVPDEFDIHLAYIEGAVENGLHVVNITYVTGSNADGSEFPDGSDGPNTYIYTGE